MKEHNYFFKLSAFQDWLIGHIKANPDWIQPAHYSNEILHLLSTPLPDLCISRPKERCYLGIDLPFDSDYVAYVWFDALINYISSLGYPDTGPAFSGYWDACTHLMAKDIIKTHLIYWPIMLKAVDLEPQKHSFVHGYWTGEGGIKMSKTIGNVVDPFKVIEGFGIDAFRYFLARTMGENESSMSYELIKKCYNHELANTISNGLYRTMKLASKEWGGAYPGVAEFSSEDGAFLDAVAAEAESVLAMAPSLGQVFYRARKVYEIGKMINNHFDKRAPWVLVKSGDPGEFNSCIMTCIEALRLMAEIACPIMPDTSMKALESLGVETRWDGYEVKPRVLRPGGSFTTPALLFQRQE
jgi:methionyl-tRNA synthetase